MVMAITAGIARLKSSFVSCDNVEELVALAEAEVVAGTVVADAEELLAELVAVAADAELEDDEPVDVDSADWAMLGWVA